MRTDVCERGTQRRMSAARKLTNDNSDLIKNVIFISAHDWRVKYQIQQISKMFNSIRSVNIGLTSRSVSNYIIGLITDNESKTMYDLID